jgi:TolA-binding protein
VVAALREAAGREAPPPSRRGDGDGGKPPRSRDGARPPVAVAVEARSTGRLGAIETALSRGDAARAKKQLDEYIPTIREGRVLARALFLAGAARLKLAGQGEAGAAMLREAVLYFMRVAVFYPEQADAAEALLRAGEASASLGDVAGASAAYRLIGLSHADSKFAEQAERKLRELAERKPQPKAAPPDEPETESDAAGERDRSAARGED